MPFVAARCPQCGGEIQLDNNKEVGYCMHCGSKIIVKEAINIVRFDNSHLIDNYLPIAMSALDGENYLEAELYCNKILEINSNHVDAWFIKGASIACQSSASVNRFIESYKCWENAVSNLDINKVNIDNMLHDIYSHLKTTVLSYLQSHVDLFKSDPTKFNASNVIEYLDNLRIAQNWVNNKKILLFDFKNIYNVVLRSINNSIVDIHGSIINYDYLHKNKHPSDDDFTDFIAKTDLCIGILEAAVRLGDKTLKSKLKIYDNLIYFQTSVINAQSYAYFNKHGFIDWYPNKELSPSEKQSRRDKIDIYYDEKDDVEFEIEALKKLKEAEAQENYWRDHPKEYQAFLLKEQEQKKQEEHINAIKKKILILQSKRNELGLFERTKRKEIDELIKNLESQIISKSK